VLPVQLSSMLGCSSSACYACSARAST
jgi:hypothetical protein